jgi:transcriptional regulator with XRE-family HTH domain
MTPEERRRAGGAVAERMQELGMTVQETADKAGLDPRTVRRLLAGETWPRDETRRRILAALDLPSGQLVRRIWASDVQLSDVPTAELAQELCKRLTGHKVPA